MGENLGKSTAISFTVASNEPDNYVNPAGTKAKYSMIDVAVCIGQSPNGKVGYYKGFHPNHPDERTFIVSLDINNNPIVGNGIWVAMPCPPLCGNDSNFRMEKTKPIDEKDIPYSF